MSIEDLKKYGQMCATKPDVRQKAKAIGIDNVDGQIAYAKELGLLFTAADMVALAKEAGLSSTNELSEGDMEKVAGGVTAVGAATSAASAAGDAAAQAASAVGSAVSSAGSAVSSAASSVVSAVSSDSW